MLFLSFFLLYCVINEGWVIGNSWVMTFSFVFFLGIHKCTFFFYLSHFDGLFMNFFFFLLSFTRYFFFLFDHQRHFTSPGFIHRSSLLFTIPADRLQITYLGILELAQIHECTA